MEKLELFKDGVLKLPPGFRFDPTDEELVVQYLKRKALRFPLPAAVIPEINLYKFDPWDLPGDSEGEKYFFYFREAKYPNGTRSNKAACSGYWKATGKDRRITASGNQLVGMKQTFVFYQGKPPYGYRTDWVMHEYRLAGTSTTAHNENWVVCRIFMKNRTTEVEGADRRHRSVQQVIDFMMQQSSSAYSSSRNLSCVTDLSDESSNGDEADSKSIVSSPHG